MKLIDFLNVASEYRKIVIRNVNGENTAIYDGKNSIDEKYNDKEILCVSAEDNNIIVYVK